MASGIFTTLKVKNGIPLFFDRHHNRLRNHMQQLRLPPLSLDLEEAIKTHLAENKQQNYALRITIKKQGDHSVVTFEARELPSIERAIKVLTINDVRDDLRTLKTTDRLVNQHAKRLAEKNGADDALFIQNNHIIESTICNVFSLNKKGQVITPPIEGRGLNGITRQLIMEQIGVIEEEISENATGPLVLVNCLRIQKVGEINGKKLTDGKELLQKIITIINNAEKEYLL